MTNEQLREIAERIADTAPQMYTKYDCCPFCRYDGLWWAENREEMVGAVLDFLKRGDQ